MTTDNIIDLLIVLPCILAIIIQVWWWLMVRPYEPQDTVDEIRPRWQTTPIHDKPMPGKGAAPLADAYSPAGCPYW